MDMASSPQHWGRRHTDLAPHRQPRRLRARIPKRCKPRSQADVVRLVFLHRVVSRLTLFQQVEGYANEDHYRCRYLCLDRHHRRSHRQGVSLSVVYRYEWLLTGCPQCQELDVPLVSRTIPRPSREAALMERSRWFDAVCCQIGLLYTLPVTSVEVSMSDVSCSHAVMSVRFHMPNDWRAGREFSKSHWVSSLCHYVTARRSSQNLDQVVDFRDLVVSVLVNQRTTNIQNAVAENFVSLVTSPPL